MAKQRTTEQDRYRSTIQISCSYPIAREIALTRSFNDWDPVTVLQDA